MTATTIPQLPTQEEALSLIDTVIQRSQAEGVFVTFQAANESLSRFSENQISQNIQTNQAKLTVTSSYGQRSASAATSELDIEAIAQTVRRSEEFAQIAPQDPEWVPLLEPQTYEDRQPAFDRSTANLSPIARGEMVQQVCDRTSKAGVNGSGTLSSEASVLAIGNSLGLRAFQQNTQANFSVTARIDDGSSWMRRSACAVGDLPILELTENAIERACQSRQPREISPGKYPVVFEGAALADLLFFLIFNLDARAADEGRSFMSRYNESGEVVGDRVGESLFSSLVQISRHPGHPALQMSPFFRNGLPNSYLEIVRDGVPQALSYSRYWAQEKGKEPTGMFLPVVMAGCDRSTADLIAQTERGIFVSRAWYVRYVNPRTLEVTGMTRDGTFWIENGKLAYPIKNLRFNQCLPDMMAQVDALGTPQRYGASVVPSVRVREFHFSSVTDSV